MNITKKRLISIVAIVLTLGLLGFFLSSCDDGNDTADNETKTQQDSYSRLAKEQPATTMSYSPTRDTILQWIKTWSQKGKISYVYLVSNGKPYAFAVLKGLPVSYCVSLTPNYRFVGTPDDGDSAKDQQVPAPGVDGAYYSGGDCQDYYGFDATTGTYFGFTAGADTTVVTRDQPYPLNLYQDALPLGDTNAADSQNVPDDTKTVTSP